MKSDLMVAITQLAAEKNLPKEVVLKVVEEALAFTFKKDAFTADHDILVKVAPQSGEFRIYAQKVAVENPTDPACEISLDEARKLKEDVQIGRTVEVAEPPPRNAGRIVAQTVKQVVLQRLHEAERDAVFAEYADKEGDIVSGVVQYIEPRQIVIDLGRAEAVLPAVEQSPGERYRVGQRIKVYLAEVLRSSKGPQLIVSRVHPDLLRRLFELEIPEIYHGTVELKAIAREAGYRSKVAVAALQDGIDPVGCCVGLRGIRIQNIVSQLNGERIDAVQWDADPAVFVANALSPASVLSVELDEDENVATVVVPDRQLSLAIGKEGRNARLAAKLTGWRIDLKSSLVEEPGKVAPQEEAPVGGEIVEAKAESPALEVPAEVAAPQARHEELLPLQVEESQEEAPQPEEAEPIAIADIVLPSLSYPDETSGQPRIRFAEDILIPRGPGRDAGGKKKGKRKKKH